MNDATYSKLTGIKINRAAQRRRHAAERARYIAALGWTPEPSPCPRGEEYCASTGELKQECAKLGLVWYGPERPWMS